MITNININKYNDYEYNPILSLTNINLISGKNKTGKYNFLRFIYENYENVHFDTSILKGEDRILELKSNINSIINDETIKDRIYLINEIENSLDHINLKKMIEYIIEVSIEHDIQFFIVTYSNEVLSNFINKIIEIKNKDMISFYRFSKWNNNLIKNVYYTGEMIEISFEMSMDIRCNR